MYVLTTNEQNQRIMLSKTYSNDFSDSEENLLKKLKKILTEKKKKEMNKVLEKMKTLLKCSESFQIAMELVRIHISILK